MRIPLTLHPVSILGAVALFALAGLAACQPQEPSSSGLRPELTGLYRATRAIEGSISVGVTYSDFSGLLQVLGKELLLAEDNIRFNPAVDRRFAPVINQYRLVLDMYRDSERMWGFEIHKEADDPAIAEIAKRYGLAEAVFDPQRQVDRTTSHIVQYARIRQEIWLQAGKVHEGQISTIFGAALPHKSKQKKPSIN